MLNLTENIVVNYLYYLIAHLEKVYVKAYPTPKFFVLYFK